MLEIALNLLRIFGSAQLIADVFRFNYANWNIAGLPQDDKIGHTDFCTSRIIDCAQSRIRRL